MNILYYNINDMSKDNSARLVKYKIFFPIALLIILVITIVALLFINSSIKTFENRTISNLKLEVKTITKMFERERQLKLEKVKTNLKIANKIFYNQDIKFNEENLKTEIINQISGEKHFTDLKNWKLNNISLFNNYDFVDTVKSLLGGTATIFQKTDSGYVRISTNVLNKDGSRAVNTYIPNSSPVIKSIEKGKTYYGRAYVVNDWYITAYEPIYNKEKIVGILYVGNKEKDLDKLRNILYSLKIGKSGYPFVFDNKGKVLIHPKHEGSNWKDSSLFKKFTKQDTNIIRYKFNSKKKIAAFNYYKKFDIYIVATIVENLENKDFVRNTILNSIIIAVISIIILSVILYLLTAERIFRYLKRLEQSKEKLISAKEALRQSEDRFQKLFNSVGDEIFVTDENENIIEVNQASCISLGYEREELLKMKMSDIKTEKFKEKVSENRKQIYKLGIYTFESEHITKNNDVVPVELTSRVVNYNNDKLILSVSRNIGERKENEREILSTVIRTEERERARFAKDMHDSVGPLLSTIKLYVNELKSASIEQEERTDFVNQTNEIIDEAVSSIRTISNNLMPSIINKYGLIKAIKSFCEKVNKTNKVKIDFSSDNIEKGFDQNMDLILFRIITELFNNTLKHAKAENIKLNIMRYSGKVVLYFEDNGIGFDVEKIMNSDHKGMGIKNIISRIKSIEGEYKITSKPGNGFKINIYFYI